MAFDLDRFVQAQAPVMPAVEAELRAGRKTSHWMWFVFPQIAGLGSSPMAQRYAIQSRAEAEAYLAHPVLGQRLRDCTSWVLAATGRTAHQVFGDPDTQKFRSSMTLFDAVAPGTVFADALDRFFGTERDPHTLRRL
jgi:uncharacterized protein (DUF1810 family)